MRELARAPRLRRVSDGSSPRVSDDWLMSMPAGVEARHDGSSAVKKPAPTPAHASPSARSVMSYHLAVDFQASDLSVTRYE